MSPTATHPGLRAAVRLAGPPVRPRGEPEVYYPTGVRNFFRVVPARRPAGRGQAMLAKQLGLQRVFVVAERASIWKQIHADPFRRAAPGSGSTWSARPATTRRRASYAGLAARVADARPDGVFLGRVVVRRRRPRAEGAARASRPAPPDHGHGPVRPDRGHARARRTGRARAVRERRRTSRPPPASTTPAARALHARLRQLVGAGASCWRPRRPPTS